MKNFKIPVVWLNWGLLNVEANTLEEAIVKADDMSLPYGEYIEDSFEVDLEGVDIYNTEEGERVGYR